MVARQRNGLWLVSVLFFFVFLAGCAQSGLEYAPKGPYLGYHQERPAAERAVEAARAAGKARECPAEFAAAEKLKDDAYQTYWACRTNEAIAKANDAAAKANALCPPRAAAPVPPPPPAPAVPTAAITASPSAIQAGQCATLTWSSANATSTSLNHGLGAVTPSGSRQVCPTSTTAYLLTATGAGGVASEVATVNVTTPPPPAAPTATLAASPASIQRGQCATLTWSATNATSTAIDQGIGSVAPSGSRQVCPSSNTNYVLTATGAGGSKTASTTVGVTTPPPPAPVERQTLHINFDTNKATIRQADIPELQKAVEFAKRYPGRKISIEGHTDNVGNAKYNQGLSERRAAAVKEYLLKNGVSGGERITTVGYGQTKPIADNATANGRFQNRRVELVALP